MTSCQCIELCYVAHLGCWLLAAQSYRNPQGFAVPSYCGLATWHAGRGRTLIAAGRHPASERRPDPVA
jgi:hypothetical protein